MALITNPTSGIGITLGYEDPAGSTYAPLVQLRDDCGFDGFDTTVINVPTLGQAVVYKVPGRTDNGTFTGSCYLIPSETGVAKIMSLAASKVTENWQLMLTNGSTLSSSSAYQFAGFISNIVIGNFSGEDAPTIEFTIAISGPITQVAGS